MAERRMFSKDITESDFFLDMPLSTQALYFHLCMYADDDGFLGGYRKIMRMCGASQNEYDLLKIKNFLIEFDDGVVVVKHWLMHNYLRKDRYRPTSYLREREMLFIKENKAYTLDETQGLPFGTPVGIPVVDVGKGSIGKESIGNTKTKRKAFTPPTLEEVTSYCKERNNSVECSRFIDFYAMKGWMVGKNKMKDWKAAVRTWEGNTPKTKSTPTEKINRNAPIRGQT